MKERNKEKENRKRRLIVVSIRPGASACRGSQSTPSRQPSGPYPPRPDHPENPTQTQRADAPGRRHEISEYKILNIKY
jgi:hypothetical protein